MIITILSLLTGFFIGRHMYSRNMVVPNELLNAVREQNEQEGNKVDGFVIKAGKNGDFDITTFETEATTA